jgi:hypothetical protein
MKHVMALGLLVVMVASGFAAPAPQAPIPQASSGSSPKKSVRKASTATPSVAAQLDQMKQAIDAQQQQIQQLRQDLQTRDQSIQQLKQRLDQSQTAATQAQGQADAAASATAKQEQSVTALSNDVADLKQNSTNAALTLQETQKTISGLESPLALHVKGITITPGGFLVAETVWRQRALASDVNTPFNSTVFSGSSQSKLSEFFASGRQSRISMLAEGKLKNATLRGYVEADFLSAGVTSNNNQSNSYTLRQRQAWGQAALTDGWSFTGGQMWSLVTETKKGMDNRTEALPMTIDAQYTAGFSWARQYGFRVVKNLSDKLWLGFSVESSQETLTAHGNAANFVIGSLGNSGGLYNAFNANYSFNPSPDFVFKAALEPSKWSHFEVFGLIDQFRDRTFPCATASAGSVCDGVTGPSSAGASNNSTTGWGMGGNGRVSLINKHVDVGIHFLGGDGIGRYGTVGLSDATVRPDGTLALLRSYQALGTLEYHASKLDVYFNGGGEYAQKYWQFNAAGKPVGYGSPLFNNSGCSTELPPGAGGFAPTAPASCTGDTRNLIEGTFGFWYRFYNGPKGRLQWGPQYSYIVRNTWAGASAFKGIGFAPHGVENMFMTSFRYYLP